MMPQAFRLLLATLITLGFLGPPAIASDYRLRTGDALSVAVVGHPELSVPSQPIRPDGRISLPLVDPVQVEGRTVEEITQTIQDAYRSVLTSPRIVVSIAQFRPLRVTVLGQVERTGSFEFQKPPTLVEALATAGGLNRRAARNAITVVDPVNRTRETYDLDRLLVGEAPIPVIPEGGIIEVGEVWGPDFQVWLPIFASMLTAVAFMRRWD